MRILAKTTVLITVTYPNDVVNEMGQAYIKNAPNRPKTVKSVGETPYVTASDQGIKVLALYAIKDENLADALRGLTQYYTNYNEIPGYRWKLEYYMSAAEALPLIGIVPLWQLNIVYYILSEFFRG